MTCPGSYGNISGYQAFSECRWTDKSDVQVFQIFRCEEYAFAEIQKLVMEKPLKIKQSAFTRWLSHDLAVKSTVKSYEVLVIHLDKICASSNPRVNTMSGPTADGILKGLRKYSILLFLHDCLPVWWSLSLIFQRRDIDRTIIEPALQNTLSALHGLLQQSLAQWHTCQPHANNYLALSRLATLVAYSSLMVKKKDGSIPFSVNFRQVNAVTRNDAQQLPRIDDTLDTFPNCYYFFPKL